MTLDRVQAFIGEVARPYAIIVTATGAAASSIIIAIRVDNGNDGALVLGAVFGGVALYYGAKAWEVVRTTQSPPVSPQVEPQPQTAPDHQS